MSRADIEAVRTAVASVPHLIDGKRWDALRALFADRMLTDYTSLFGGAPQEQSSEDLVKGWKTSLGKVSTQHLLGPIVVTTTTAGAEAACHVRALHLAPSAAGGPEWEVLGHYRFALVRDGYGWRITRLILETLAQTGNTKLLAEA